MMRLLFVRQSTHGGGRSSESGNAVQTRREIAVKSIIAVCPGVTTHFDAQFFLHEEGDERQKESKQERTRIGSSLT